MELHWQENPKPDERSAEEQSICDAAWKALGAPITCIGVGADAPGTPSRRVHVAISCGFWGRRRFRKRHAAVVSAVRAVVRETDAQISVALVTP